MRFYREDDVPYEPEAVTFGPSVLHALFGLGCAVGLTAIPLVMMYFGHDDLMLKLMAGGMGLFVLVALGAVRMAVRSDAWLMRVVPDGVLVKFRSPRNRHFPREDVTVVRIDRAELVAVRKSRQVRVTPQKSDGDRHERFTYVDLVVRSRDLDQLKSHLRAERARRGPKGGMGVQTTHLHYPVTIVEPDVVRLEWTSPQTWTRPGVKRALAALSRLAPVRDGGDERLDFTVEPADKAARAKQEAELVTLVESGDTIAAVRVAERLYGYSTTQANQFVKELAGRAPASRT